MVKIISILCRIVIHFLIVILIGFILCGGYLKFLYYIKVQPKRISLPNIIGFVDQPSFPQGANIPVFIHTQEPAKASLYRLGENIEKIKFDSDIPALLQKSEYDPQNGFLWKPTAHIQTSNFKSGYY